jgi:type IV pilus assembly protein PilE
MKGEGAVHKRHSGVTLVELMTVMVIVAILAAVAIPGYRNYVLRANRSDAKAALLFNAGALERCYTRYNSYVLDPSPLIGCTLTFPVTSANGYYAITANPAPTANTFTLVATPQGTQASDTGCGNLTLDSTNRRNKTGTKSVAECWGK